MRTFPWMLAGCVACSGVAPTATPDAADPRTDAAVGVDAQPPPDGPAAPCDPSRPFGARTPLASLNTGADEEFASLTSDELTIYFASNRDVPGSAQFDLYIATRATRDTAFTAPVKLTTVSMPGDDRSPSISTDGLELFFHSSRDGGYDLWVATRASTAVGFEPPVKLGAAVNSAEFETSPALAADGSALYFERSTPTTTDQLWRAARGPTGFANATPVAAFAAGEAFWAAPSNDERTLYIASRRSGGAGSVDAWVATRATAADPWGAARNVTELNTDEQDAVDWVSPDGCRVYVTAARDGHFDLWTARRP